MRLSPLFVGISLSLAVQASWFGGSTTTDSAAHPYSTWSASELRDWLDVHSVSVPKGSPTTPELRALVADNWQSTAAWTYEQYASAQKSFGDLRESSFDAWDESRLREWLLKQGVVAPKGPREKLVLMAREKYWQYTQAASSFSKQAGAAGTSLSSVVEKAASPVVAAFDETKHYIYSTWDEGQMRKYLEEKGVLKTKGEKKKDELLQMMHNAYGKVADPVWQSWSDSYLHDWLVGHDIIKSGSQKQRDHYVDLMKTYYYSTSDSVWHSWSDSQLRNWLINQNLIKSDAQVSRDKMLDLIKDKYLSAKDTFWDAWSDKQIKEWLVGHGYMRSDAQVKRDELIKAAEAKYKDVKARRAAYLTWPDARLRAYLREHGMSDDIVPGGRPGLLQEVRIRWVQTETRTKSMAEKIRERVNGSVNKLRDVFANILHLFSNGWVDLRSRTYGAAKERYEDAKRRAEKEKQYNDAKKQYREAKGRAEEVESWMEEKWDEVKQSESKPKSEL